MEEIWQYILPVGTAIASWIAGRKMQRLEYSDKSQQVIKNLQEQNSELLARIGELEDKIVDLTKQLTEARISLLQVQQALRAFQVTDQGAEMFTRAPSNTMMQ